MIFLNMATQEEFQIAFGSEFQRLGAGMEKILSPQLLCSVQMGGQEISISRAHGAGRRLSMEEPSQIGWGQVMEGFVGL